MLKKLAVGLYQANCYILGCKETNEGLVIDPGGDVFHIVNEITKMDLVIKYILITHGHFDHTGGVNELRRITKAPVYLHPADAFGSRFPIDVNLADGQEIKLGTYTISVIHTPGHSPGGVCFHTNGAIFTGDTLFAGSIGRTDFPGCSHEQLIQGVVQRLFPLGDDLRIYPGHGPHSTIGQERRYNPFFR